MYGYFNTTVNTFQDPLNESILRHFEMPKNDN